jgi:hypothetical protein
MERLSFDDLQALVRSESPYCISIFLPTYRSGPEVKQNVVQLNRLLDSAEETLALRGLSSEIIKELMSPAKEFVEGSELLEHPQDGLAIFVGPQFFRYYLGSFYVQEQVIVAEKFIIRPLIQWIADKDRKFYVLALSENFVRVLEGSSENLSEIPVKEMPKSMREAMRFNDPERQLQLHTQTPRIPGARAAAIFHGHGVGIDDKKDDQMELCRQIDRALHLLLKEEKAPLVLAGVDPLVSIFRRMSAYSYVMKENVHGNPELVSDAELHDRAWKIVLPYFEKKKQDALRTYTELKGTDLVSNSVDDILLSAREGRVRYLFLNQQQDWWGKYDSKSRNVETHENYQQGDQEISNIAATESLKIGATVYRIDPVLPEYPGLFAVYRY